MGHHPHHHDHHPGLHYPKWQGAGREKNTESMLHTTTTTTTTTNASWPSVITSITLRPVPLGRILIYVRLAVGLWDLWGLCLCLCLFLFLFQCGGWLHVSSACY